MSRKPCPNPNREGCPYAERPIGCHSDKDHVVPQRYRSLGWLVGKYIYTPENIEQRCRWEHEQKTAEESPDLIPDATYMVDAVRRAFDSGYLTLSKKDQQRLVLVEEALIQTEVAS